MQACPHCTSMNHHAVDVDGEGEALRFCDDCGQNFRLASRAAMLNYVPVPGLACLTCGREMVGPKAHAVGFDYCRDCFYTGNAYEHLRSAQLAEMRAALPGWTVGVEHTGGGCFWLAFYPPNHDPDRHTMYAATDGEASLPDATDDDGHEVPIRDGWGYVGRYCWSVDADEENEHPDGVEGTIILEPDPGDDDYWDTYPKHARTDAEIIETIRADWESRSA